MNAALGGAVAEPTLNDYTSDMLEEHVFAGADAATYFVPEESDEPPEHVRRILDRSPEKRIYPVDGGNEWWVPWDAVEGHEDLFGQEPGGWDHEHCSFCRSTIGVGEVYWTTDHPVGGCLMFCRECRAKVTQP